MNPMQHLNRAATVVVVVGTLLILLAIGQIIRWSVDRRVPVELISYVANPALPGDTVIVRAVVKRDVDRRCSLMYSRMFHDSAGVRFDITAGAQMMTADALDDLNRRTPDSLILSLTIPPKAAPGKGTLISVLDYVCNPVQQLYPIPKLITMDVEVL